MSISEFYQNNKTLIIVLGVLLVVWFVYKWYDRKTTKNDDLPDSKICMTTETQKKIIDDFNKKLNEIKGCDCTDACKVKPKETTSVAKKSDTPDKPNIPNTPNTPNTPSSAKTAVVEAFNAY